MKSVTFLDMCDRIATAYDIACDDIVYVSLYNSCANVIDVFSGYIVPARTPFGNKALYHGRLDGGGIIKFRLYPGEHGMAYSFQNGMRCGMFPAIARTSIKSKSGRSEYISRLSTDILPVYAGNKDYIIEGCATTYNPLVGIDKQEDVVKCIFDAHNIKYDGCKFPLFCCKCSPEIEEMTTKMILQTNFSKKKLSFFFGSLA